MTRLLRCWVREDASKIVRGLACQEQETRLTGCSIMDARGGDEMSHVVHLKVHRIAETFFCFTMPLCNLDVGVDVAVRLLGPGDDLDNLIHLSVERYVLRNGKYRC